MAVEFSQEAKKKFDDILSRYPIKEAALLPAMHLAEKEIGPVTDEVIVYLADLLEIPPVRIKNVKTFYTMFREEGMGKYVIQVCNTLPCALRGADQIVDHLRTRLGIDVGETTPDNKFTLKRVECLGSCDTAPVIQINDFDYNENLSIEMVDKIMDGLE